MVAAIAHDALGADAVACTARSETLPAEELADAKQAAEEIGVHHELDAYSPLLATDISKDEVREIADHYDLSVADKPSMACLSSRIPTGLEVTDKKLTRVEQAERLLRTWGFDQFRVRDHDGLARIEVGHDELTSRSTRRSPRRPATTSRPSASTTSPSTWRATAPAASAPRATTNPNYCRPNFQSTAAARASPRTARSS